MKKNDVVEGGEMLKPKEANGLSAGRLSGLKPARSILLKRCHLGGRQESGHTRSMT